MALTQPTNLAAYRVEKFASRSTKTSSHRVGFHISAGTTGSCTDAMNSNPTQGQQPTHLRSTKMFQVLSLCPRICSLLNHRGSLPRQKRGTSQVAVIKIPGFRMSKISSRDQLRGQARAPAQTLRIGPIPTSQKLLGNHPHKKRRALLHLAAAWIFSARCVGKIEDLRPNSCCFRTWSCPFRGKRLVGGVRWATLGIGGGVFPVLHAQWGFAGGPSDQGAFRRCLQIVCHWGRLALRDKHHVRTIL